MNIGTFKREGNDLIGNISTFGATFDQVTFEAVSGRDTGPDYIIHANGGELGAAWTKTSAKGNTYLSVSFKGPLLAKPIYAALLESTKAPGTFALVWNEPEDKTK